jgi:hypothetical protein
MNRLWTYGDSFTESFEISKTSDETDWKIPYLKWKGYTPKVYPQILAEDLNLILINRALSGIDNHTIFENVVKDLDKIQIDDVVIINWTSTLRFRIINKWDMFSSIIPNDYKYNGKHYTISSDTLDDMIVMRDSVKYMDEVNHFIKIINKVLPNNKIIHWTPFDNDCNINADTISHLERIWDETNKEVNDYHFSETGHLELSRILYNRLVSQKTDII